jgi:hypothetical protein
MKARLASLFLLLVLAGSTFAGMPMHFSAGECGMNDMMDMDCCETALTQESSPKVAEEILSCALDCAKYGTTAPPNIVRVTPPPLASALSHPALKQALVNSLLFRRIDRLHGPPDSGSKYLRNLALLI